MQRTRSFRETSSTEVKSAPVQAPAYTTPGASTKQLDFIQSLVDERQVKDETLQILEPKLEAQRSANLEHGDSHPEIAGLSKRVASDIITKLMDLPRKPKENQLGLVALANGATHSAPEVPNGRYALEASDIEPGDSGIRFYKVNTPTEGRWAGFTFVDAQASDDFHPIRNKAHKAQILQAIAKDPETAMTRYGKELGVCGHCGRTLTDDESRARGIGPVCLAKMSF